MSFSGRMYAIFARDHLGRPDAELVTLEALDMDHDGIDATKVTVADVPKIQTGPNAGNLNWRRKTNVAHLFVLPGMVEAWLAEHPEMCGECANERRVFVGWKLSEGTRFTPCHACTDKYEEADLVLFEASA